MEVLKLQEMKTLVWSVVIWFSKSLSIIKLNKFNNCNNHNNLYNNSSVHSLQENQLKTFYLNLKIKSTIIIIFNLDQKLVLQDIVNLKKWKD